jgi:hypothetical protein
LLSFVHMLLPMPQIPLDSVEIPDEILGFHLLLLLLHRYETAKHGIVKLVEPTRTKVVGVSSTLIVIVGNIDFDEDKVVDKVKMKF